MSHTIAFAPDVALTLSWDDPPTGDVDPGWWTASGTLELSLRPTGGGMHVVLTDVDVTADALVHFDDALTRLLEDLSGSVTLEPLTGIGERGDFGLTATLDRGKGTLSGFAATAHHPARVTFDGVGIDQTFLAETQRQVRSLLAHRPALNATD